MDKIRKVWHLILRGFKSYYQSLIFRGEPGH